IRVNNLWVKYLRGKFHQVIHTRDKPVPSTSFQAGGVHAQRLKEAFFEVVRKIHAGGIGNNLGGPLVAGRRINTAVIYRALDLTRVKVHAGGMREQVPQRGAFGTDRKSTTSELQSRFDLVC